MDTMATRNITLTMLKNANALSHDLQGYGMWHCCSKSFETGLRRTYVYLLVENYSCHLFCFDLQEQ